MRVNVLNCSDGDRSFYDVRSKVVYLRPGERTQEPVDLDDGLLAHLRKAKKEYEVTSELQAPAPMRRATLEVR